MNYFSKLMLCTAAFVGSPANAANTVSFVQTPFTTATIESFEFRAVAGSGATNPSAGIYAFEIENSRNPYWNSVGGTVPADGVLKRAITGRFDLQTNAGYQITSMWMGGGGIWQSTNGAAAGVSRYVRDNQSNFISDSRSYASASGASENGGWKVSSAPFLYPAGLSTLSGNFFSTSRLAHVIPALPAHSFTERTTRWLAPSLMQQPWANSIVGQRFMFQLGKSYQPFPSLTDGQ
jgi:hypothetical protein